MVDRGRMIDHIQNVNAMKIDRFGATGITSTRVIHPPGGETHWHLGWGNDQVEEQPKVNKKKIDFFRESSEFDNNFGGNYNNTRDRKSVV